MVGESSFARILPLLGGIVILLLVAGLAWAYRSNGPLSSAAATASPTISSSPATGGTVVSGVTLLPTNTIADNLKPLSNLSLVNQALQFAGLEDTLRSSGPFTVFAPTDDALRRQADKVTGMTVEDLQKPENKDKLVTLENYHIVNGVYTTADLVNDTKLTTRQGEALAVTVRDGKTYLNDVPIETADIVCSNGIIHIIDGVLVPSALK